MLSLADTRKAHRNETRQRNGLEESAALWLNGIENSQALLLGERTNEAGHRKDRWTMKVTGLPNRNKRGQGITDDRKIKQVKK